MKARTTKTAHNLEETRYSVIDDDTGRQIGEVVRHNTNRAYIALGWTGVRPNGETSTMLKSRRLAVDWIIS